MTTSNLFIIAISCSILSILVCVFINYCRYKRRQEIEINRLHTKNRIFFRIKVQPSIDINREELKDEFELYDIIQPGYKNV